MKAIALYRNARLIYNPRAGAFAGRAEERIGEVLRLLREAGHGVEAFPTSGPGAATGMAREFVAGGADLIAVAGGDGTLNEALNGMVGSSVPLAALPAGTANVLAHEIGLERDPERAAAMTADLVPLRLALGLLRPSGAPARHFVMMAGAGLDARVVREVDPGLKRRIGKLAYWVASFRLVGKRLAQFDVSTGEVRRKCGFALAARVRNYGGDLEIARGASLLRDDFEAVLLEGATAGAYLKYFVGVVTGGLKRMSGATVLPARLLELRAAEADAVPLQVDGELAGFLPATIETVPDALTLLVPPRYLSGEKRKLALQ